MFALTRFVDLRSKTSTVSPAIDRLKRFVAVNFSPWNRDAIALGDTVITGTLINGGPSPNSTAPLSD
jgi:hypothetical protein